MFAPPAVKSSQEKLSTIGKATFVKKTVQESLNSLIYEHGKKRGYDFPDDVRERIALEKKFNQESKSHPLDMSPQERKEFDTYIHKKTRHVPMDAQSPLLLNLMKLMHSKEQIRIITDIAFDTADEDESGSIDRRELT